MSKKIILLELFAGVGGFSLGLKEAGFEFKEHYFSEIDKHAIANYKYNFKDAKHLGSVKFVRRIITAVNASRHAGDKVIITFGSPCQDFSLAGEGVGLEGTKSSLIKYAIFLVKWLRPDIYIWENVKGAYSTNDGADYWAIIQAFANLVDYGHEQQLINTTWFLPQNRERIYIVGHLGGASGREIFPFTEDDKVFNKSGGAVQGRSQTKHNSTALRAGGTLKATDTFIKQTAKCLTVGGKSGGLHSDMDTVIVPGTLRTHKDGEGFREVVGDDAPTLAARAREDGSGQGCVSINDSVRRFTETEYERLQGFPDGWTMYGNYDGVVKKIPATQRFKLCGNAVTKHVIKAIGERL